MNILIFIYWLDTKHRDTCINRYKAQEKKGKNYPESRREKPDILWSRKTSSNTKNIHP